MKKHTKALITVTTTFLLLFGVTTVAIAANSLENYTLQAVGRFEYDTDNSGTAGDHSSDVVYDAEELVVIEDMVKSGKTDLATAINSYPTGKVQSLDTFTNLSAAVNSLTDFPDGTYYYDATTGITDASTLVRYIKEDGLYYLCDQNGNKLSNEVQTVDEANLAEYVKITQESISAGYAGMVDKTFVLGSGSDNITAKNEGIEFADNRVDTSSASYIAGSGSKNVTLITTRGRTWNNTITLSLTVPAGNYFVVTTTNFCTSSGDYDNSYSHSNGVKYTATSNTTVSWTSTTSSANYVNVLCVAYWPI